MIVPILINDLIMINELQRKREQQRIEEKQRFKAQQFNNSEQVLFLYGMALTDDQRVNIKKYGVVDILPGQVSERICHDDIE